MFYNISKVIYFINLFYSLVKGRFYRLIGLKSKKGLKIRRNAKIINPYRVEFGENITLETGSCIKCLRIKEKNSYKKFISIGDNSWIGNNTYIEANHTIKIGADVLIAPNCYITDSSHGYEDRGTKIRNQPGVYKKVEIGNDVWIGTNSIILQGVKIGQGVVIAANSVVNKDVADFTVVGGTPAKILKKR